MNEVVVPDFAEPMIGWRAWVVRQPGPVLTSMNATVWPPRERLEALCASKHAVPDPRCRCGIYAAATRQQLAEMRYPDYDLDRDYVVVVGEVSLWGGVVPGEQGWRAQYAYPRRLLVPYEIWRLAKPLREDYGVPVKLANTFRLREV